MSELAAGYDSPWKQALELFFPDFMTFFFPAAHGDIDWRRGYQFLDKELQQVARDAELGRRYADTLAHVWRQGGEETWVLVHVEVQGQLRHRGDGAPEGAGDAARPGGAADLEAVADEAAVQAGL